MWAGCYGSSRSNLSQRGEGRAPNHSNSNGRASISLLFPFRRNLKPEKTRRAQNASRHGLCARRARTATTIACARAARCTHRPSRSAGCLLDLRRTHQPTVIKDPPRRNLRRTTPRHAAVAHAGRPAGFGSRKKRSERSDDERPHEATTGRESKAQPRRLQLPPGTNHERQSENHPTTATKTPVTPAPPRGKVELTKKKLPPAPSPRRSRPRSTHPRIQPPHQGTN